LMLAVGFATVAVACLLNAQLTSAWAGDNFWTSQLVIALGLSFTLVAQIGSFVQYMQETGALARPFDVLTFSAFIHCIRIFGGEAGIAFMQHFIAVREKFHSNLIGLHVEAGAWLTDERLRWLTGAVSPNSAGMDEAQRRSVALLGSQVRQQAYTLAYMDGFTLTAWVCVGIIALIAFMKRTGIFFDSQSPKPPGG
jgi:DHA2 family multidrug resistance protein